jgi:hypothetical protein
MSSDFDILTDLAVQSPYLKPYIRIFDDFKPYFNVFAF